MKVIRAVIPVLMILGLLSAFETSSNQKIQLQTTSPILKPTKADFNERLAPKRASRASSERSAVASADTTTFNDTLEWSLATIPPTTTTTPKPHRLKRTNTAPSTPKNVSQQNPSEENSGDAYATCLSAATEAKSEKVAPNVARWVDLVVKYFPGEVYKTCRVMACESGGNPGAIGPRQPNGSYPQGLMQILGGPFDSEANMALAASMRASRGWQPWSCK